MWHLDGVDFEFDPAQENEDPLWTPPGASMAFRSEGGARWRSTVCR